MLPYLADHPPTHILVAGFLGLKPRHRSALPAGRPPDELAAAVGPGFGAGGNVHAGMAAAVILDFAGLKAAQRRSA